MDTFSYNSVISCSDTQTPRCLVFAYKHRTITYTADLMVEMEIEHGRRSPDFYVYESHVFGTWNCGYYHHVMEIETVS